MTDKPLANADLSELEKQLVELHGQCAANSGNGEVYEYWYQQRVTVLVRIAKLRPITKIEWMCMVFAPRSAEVMRDTAMSRRQRTRGEQLVALEVEGNFVQFQFLSDAALLAEAQARSLDPNLWDTAANERYALIKALEEHQAKLNTGMLLILPYPEAWKKEDAANEDHVSTDCGGN